ncbi:hypothetical protein [Kitasatospora purpeofusca]|uniref:hypothetical protein n=1 Tax=Kitasatospora purpeofusca TaxID=67352 RepID=UPI0036650418
MDVVVLAEELEVDNLVELSTVDGNVAIRLTRVERRVNGIKFTGLNHQGTQYCFGMKYGQSATRLDM